MGTTHYPQSVENGFAIYVVDTGAISHSLLVREGCSGSSHCAMEIYAAEGNHYLSSPGVNMHFNDDEMEQLYRAIKKVRKARRNA